MTQTLFGALGAAIAETPDSFQNPVFLTVWLAVGIVGLVLGIIASSLARRRKRDQAPARRDVLPLSPVEAKILKAA